MFAVLVPAGVLAAGLKILAILTALAVFGLLCLVFVTVVPFIRIFLPPEDDEELDAEKPFLQPLNDVRPPPRDTAVEHVSP